jgi:hypothetical protein
MIIHFQYFTIKLKYQDHYKKKSMVYGIIIANSPDVYTTGKW